MMSHENMFCTENLLYVGAGGAGKIMNQRFYYHGEKGGDERHECSSRIDVARALCNLGGVHTYRSYVSSSSTLIFPRHG